MSRVTNRGAPPRDGAPPLGPLRAGGYNCRLSLGVSLQDQVADALLRGRTGGRPQQRETPALAVDAVLPCGERHVPAVLPGDGEANVWPASMNELFREFGAGDRTRTDDLLITNHFLVTFPAIR